MKFSFFLRERNVLLAKAEMTLKIVGDRDAFCNNKMAENKEFF